MYLKKLRLIKFLPGLIMNYILTTSGRRDINFNPAQTGVGFERGRYTIGSCLIRNHQERWFV